MGTLDDSELGGGKKRGPKYVPHPIPSEFSALQHVPYPQLNANSQKKGGSGTLIRDSETVLKTL